MSNSPQESNWMREVARDAVRARITDIAVSLLVDRGFDAVTVEQIATAAGISARTFHRYFATKEDVILGDTNRSGRLFAEVVAANLVEGTPWFALEAGFQAILADSAHHSAPDKRVMKLLLFTPSLRARNTEKHLDWENRVAPLMATPADPDLVQARTVVRAALGAFDIALATWAHDASDKTAADLLRTAFASLAPTPRSA